MKRNRSLYKQKEQKRIKGNLNKKQPPTTTKIEKQIFQGYGTLLFWDFSKELF